MLGIELQVLFCSLLYFGFALIQSFLAMFQFHLGIGMFTLCHYMLDGCNLNFILTSQLREFLVSKRLPAASLEAHVSVERPGDIKLF